ncbi:hypothetical protein M434DRAFT_73027, partial [Hypoxylon sp. CO27-5]
PEAWPERGEIEMTNANMRYRPELPMVLKDSSIDIHGGEKLVIVGRTGAGKSSLATAIYRLAELSWGQIIIDGLNIKHVPLPMLCSIISIVSQDTALFQVMIQSNMDPFGEYTDVELWNVLHQVCIKDNSIV